ncbi:MAG: aminotransferase class V-fold PLP-dependent enzyme [Flavobacteriaceae bacterium]|nr:aminotransferase class V-fold PLP-dependent enzyme [Flavobacteriaceae bacterium]
MKAIRRDAFPVLQTYTYLNTPASGLLSESLMEFRQEHDIDFLIGGSLFRDRHKALLEQVRKTVARFFDADIATTALVPNFTFGYENLVLALPKNLQFAMLEADYPSLLIPLQKRAYAVKMISSQGNLESNIVEFVSKNRPDVLVFSLTQYLDGRKISVPFLQKLKNDFPNMLLIADGTQLLGTRPFSFKSSPLDALAGSGYKWLLAGYGNGFLMMKSDFKTQLFPSHHDFLNAFELGHQDTFNYSSLQFALQYLKEIGLENIENHIQLLSAKAHKMFSELDLLPDEIAQNPKHDTIFTLKAPASLMAFLQSEDILTAQRGEGVRLGFHFYNDFKDLERLHKSLLKFFKK